ncbi:hypothetical protein CsSME_00010252 [Camellia sinensis var. sinensis]
MERSSINNRKSENGEENGTATNGDYSHDDKKVDRLGGDCSNHLRSGKAWSSLAAIVKAWSSHLQLTKLLE